MLILKHIHLTFVLLSFIGIFVRGIWMMTDSSLLNAKLTKILPHIIDTVLLVSAIMLAVKLGYKPSEQPWLLVKIIALLVYIALGVFALKPIFEKKVRIVFWLAALLCYAFIVSAAITKSPLGFFAF